LEAFAGGQFPAAVTMDSLALCDHAEAILRPVTKDTGMLQNSPQQIQKSMDL
jgi:hypothetical protein